MIEKSNYTEIDPPLSEAEIIDWLKRLASTDQKRIKIIEDLLRNAREDAMLESDKLICQTELARLREKVKNEAPLTKAQKLEQKRREAQLKLDVYWS